MRGRTHGPGSAGAEDHDLFGRRPTRHRDWSHRRREPRGLAFAWMLYLMLATVVSLFPMVFAGHLSGDVYRPSARVLVVFVIFGVSVLWPVLRVSQAPQHDRPVPDVVRDFAVLTLSAMVLVWPQAYLAGWSVSVVGAVSGVLVVWGLVGGTVLLWWHRFGRGGVVGRLAATGVVSVLAGLVPLVLAWAGGLGLEAPGVEPTRGWLWSPLTGVWEVLRDRPWSGMPAAVSGGHLHILAWQLLIAAILFAVTGFVCRGRRGPAASGGL